MATGTIYSSRLFAQQGVDVPTVAFTVPSSQVFVVRDIGCYVGAVDFTSSLIFKDLEDSVAWLSFGVDLGQSRSFQWTGRQAFEAGQSLLVVPDAHPWDVRITGYRLT